MTNAPAPGVTVNPFATALLNYSADRNDSIGRPERWGDPPPLVVEGTQLHSEMSMLGDELWDGALRPIWTFLVGGPGNGKSEAVGALIRRLDSRRGGGRSLIDDAVISGSGRIRYSYRCTLRPGTDLVLIQDISVPRSDGSLPEQDLVEELAGCMEAGRHLVVCANRGMLLRAMRLARATEKYRHLVADLELIDQRTQEGAFADKAKWPSQAKNGAVEIRAWPLDHESVMFGTEPGNGWLNPEASLLDQVIAKATAEQNWEDGGCSRCAVRTLCPIFNDALWLRDPQRRRSFLRFLRHSEVLGGQRIVLREALGILSTVLVGTPSDFIEKNSAMLPCEWVHDRARRDRSTAEGFSGMLELLSHRIYMDLFARAAPSGIMFGTRERAEDRWIVAALGGSGDEKAGEFAGCARQVDNDFAKQAGPPRLWSQESSLRELDPAADCSWCPGTPVDVDGTIPALAQAASPHACELERELASAYNRMEEGIRGLKPHANVPVALAALCRWFSGYFLRMTGVALGRHSLWQILDDYLALLATPTAPLESTGREKRLGDLLRHATTQAGAYQLTRGFVADLGPQRMTPEGARKRSDLPRWPANDRLALRLTPEISVVLSAATFVDIWFRHHRMMAEWCLPPSLENLIEAWRNESVVLEKKYCGLPVVKYDGSQPLEFEVNANSPVQVRKL